MELHQFVHTLNYGDAISGEAIAIQRLLERRGITSRIYSVHAHEKVREHVSDWQSCKADVARASGPVGIVSHYSIASPLNDLYGELTNTRRAMIYHNLTPERWFLGYNAKVVADLRVGRKELPQLMNLSDVLLADSDFNRRELLELGAKDVSVLSLPLDHEKWNVPSNPGITASIRGQRSKNILHVGRTAPNKRLEDIIKAFYFYHHKINQQSRLWLIGHDIDTEIYSFELRLLVRELQLKDAVQFIGSVADSELKSFYEEADLYLCMSEHEGFCVPLLEAMHFGVPVIAYDSCAVGETLADGGILLNHKNPAEIAELMNVVLEDEALRTGMVERARRRLATFSLDNFSRDVDEKILKALFETSSHQSSAVRSAG